MKPDDMVRQAKGTVDNITELAARLAAVDKLLQTADQALEDQCRRMARALRIELGDCPLEECAAAIEVASTRRRELEAGLRHALQALTDSRPPGIAASDARTELERLVDNGREKAPQT